MAVKLKLNNDTRILKQYGFIAELGYWAKPLPNGSVLRVKSECEYDKNERKIFIENNGIRDILIQDDIFETLFDLIRDGFVEKYE